MVNILNGHRYSMLQELSHDCRVAGFHTRSTAARGLNPKEWTQMITSGLTIPILPAMGGRVRRARQSLTVSGLALG